MYEQVEQLDDLSLLEVPEQGALTIFKEAIKLGAGDVKEFTDKYYLSIRLKCDFPHGIGLGSSASFSVALAASVYEVAKKLTKGTYKNLTDITLGSLEEKWKIRTIADKGENIAHKSVSGTKTAIITLGGAYKYCKDFFYNLSLYSEKHEGGR